MDSNWTSPTDCASSVCNPHDASVGCCQAVKISRTQPVSLTSWHVPLSLETEKKIRRTHGRRPSPFGRAQPTPAESVHVAAMSAAAAIARASIKAATRAGTDCKPARRLTGNQQQPRLPSGAAPRRPPGPSTRRGRRCVRRTERRRTGRIARGRLSRLAIDFKRCHLSHCDLRLTCDRRAPSTAWSLARDRPRRPGAPAVQQDHPPRAVLPPGGPGVPCQAETSRLHGRVER